MKYLRSFFLGAVLATVFGWFLLFAGSPLFSLRLPWFTLIFGICGGVIDIMIARIQHKTTGKDVVAWRVLTAMGGAGVIQVLFLLQGPGFDLFV